MSRTAQDNRIIIATYLAAVGLGVVVAAAVWSVTPRWAAVLIADVCATALVFAVSRLLDNTSVYDAYWSVAPPVIAGGLLLSCELGSPVRAVLVLLLLTAWAVRLTYNWWRGWSGIRHEDWRYVGLRTTTGRAYWLVSFFGLHMFPTMLVYAGCLALLPVMEPTARPLGWLDLVGAIVMAAAIWIEATADRQLHDFVASRPSREQVLTTGLWGRCRHPNYLGEISLWWGLAAFGLAADPSAWWVLVGPIAMTGLFVFISIPMIEKRMLRKRPAYADVVRRYPCLLPLGPR